jgi:hypothetical protein
MISTKIFHMALISLSRRNILKQPKWNTTDGIVMYT